MNPRYGAVMERGRQSDGDAHASAQDSGQGQAHSDSDGHWATINHRHVLIQESRGNGRERHKRPKGKPLPSSGQASIYSDIFDGEKTSSGDRFDQKGYTAALLPRSRWHAVPLGTRVELTHDGKSVIVEINDRGAGDRTGTPILPGRLIFLARQLPRWSGMTSAEMMMQRRSDLFTWIR
jgi:rare lipoprotein A